jgi:hypothetical protein
MTTSSLDSKARVAMRCALESFVSYPLAWAVLYGGKPIKSLNTQRVAAWARQNNFKLPGAPKPAKETKAALEELDAMLEAAEAKRAAR